MNFIKLANFLAYKLKMKGEKGMDLIVTELNEGEKYSNLSKTELVSLLTEIIDESVIYVEVKKNPSNKTTGSDND